MAETPSSARLDQLVNCIRESIAQVFSQALSAAWNVDVRPEGLPADDGSSRSSVTFALSGALEGDIELGVRNSDAVLLAQKFLGEPPAEAELNGERTEAFEELIRQVAGLAVTSMKPHFGEVHAEVRLSKPAMHDGVTLALSASEASGGVLWLEMRVDQALIEDHAAVAETASAPGVGATTDPNKDEIGDSAARTAAIPDAPVEEGDGQDNIGRLSGVDLALSLQFGQTMLTLRELMDLSPGAVVELDRHVDEPVDLLIGNKPIARGSVVVVAGNYGIKIAELMSARALD